MITRDESDAEKKLAFLLFWRRTQNMQMWMKLQRINNRLRQDRRLEAVNKLVVAGLARKKLQPMNGYQETGDLNDESD